MRKKEKMELPEKEESKGTKYLKIGGVVVGIIALIGVFLSFCGKEVYSETINWNNPTVYADNTVISSSDQALITTKIYYGTTGAACLASLSPFVSLGAGILTWTGTLPVTQKGTTTYYCGTSTLGGLESVKSPAVAYLIPFVAPGPPSLINIVK